MLTIKTDSRKVKKGDTFVALRGLSSDGHDYIENAIQNGASHIVAEEGNYDVSTTIVPNTRQYLEQRLYEEYHSLLEDMTIIGITGTNGKTTSCYLIYEALQKLGRKVAYIGTIGFYMEEKVRELPNTSPDICDMYDMLITSYEQGYRYVVMEVSSQGLSYGRLRNIPFDYAIFTNLTQDHLDYHKTMENYAKAKQQLFYQVKIQGKAIINIDDEYHHYYEIGNVLRYGFQESDYQITNLHFKETGTSFQVKDFHIQTSLLGRYNVYNATCAVIILDLLGISKEEIERVMPTLLPPPGRLDIIPFLGNTVIVDYAHTPDAMANIFKTIEELPHRKTYVVFGCTGRNAGKSNYIR